MKVLVIGGTGNISSAVVSRLLALKHEVTVLNRGLRPVRYDGKVEQLICDRKDRTAFEALLNGRVFDAAIDMVAYNVDDAKSTLKALKDSVGHFVFTSTVATYKRPFAAVPIKEDFKQYDTPIFPYGFEKAKMENYLREEMTNGINITIIRPSLTYGIGCKNIGVMRNNYGIIKRIRSGKRIIQFGDGTNPWAWTFAPDIAKAYAGVLCREKCFGQSYHVTSDDHHIWDDLYLTFGKIIGIEPKLVHVSTEMLMAAAPEVFLHVQQEKMYCGIFDNSKIKADVPEFKCDNTLEGMLREITNWYESDENARIIDTKLDELEDSLLLKYDKVMDIWK